MTKTLGILLGAVAFGGLLWLVITLTRPSVEISQQSDAAAEYHQCGNNLRSLAFYLELYRTEKGRYPKRLRDILFTQTAPNKDLVLHCPAINGPPSSVPLYRYETSAKSNSYTLICSGLAHFNAGYPRNSPTYSSGKGLQY